MFSSHPRMHLLAAQAQIMTAAAAGKHPILAGVKHPVSATLAVMYYGTLEVGWVAPRQMLSWAEGIRQRKHRIRKSRKGFPDALDEARSCRALHRLLELCEGVGIWIMGRVSGSRYGESLSPHLVYFVHCGSVDRVPSTPTALSRVESGIRGDWVLPNTSIPESRVT